MRRLSLATALTMALLPGTALAAGSHGTLGSAAHPKRPAHKANTSPPRHRPAVIAHMAGGGHGKAR